MNYSLKILSSRIAWVLINAIFFVDIHFKIISKIVLLDSLDINILGFMDYELDILNLQYFSTILIIYKIITTIGIIVLLDKIYTSILIKIKKPYFDIEYLESLDTIPPSIPPEILNILQFKPQDSTNAGTPQTANFDPKSLKATQQHSTLPSENKNEDSRNSATSAEKLEKNYIYSKVLEDRLEELNSLIGLDSVKKEITSIINFIRVNQLRIRKGLPNHEMSYHMVFTGNPGTGKTTVARLLAIIFKELGLISSGHFIEVDRSLLVAGYVGQTAIKVKEVIERSVGGVLFIDEAYSLTNENSKGDYGQEAVDTLLKYMEDYRNDLIVVVAGYDTLMKNFVNSNPGLKSRFNRFIHFEDYSANELLQIMKKMAKKTNYVIAKSAQIHLLEYFSNICSIQKDKFGNGRGARNLFEKTITSHANRMSLLADPSPEALSVLILQDILDGISEISNENI